MCRISVNDQKNNRIIRRQEGILTVEASLILPIVLFCIIAFLYFIRIMYVQEEIQRAINKTGLSLAKNAYVYGDFIRTMEEAGVHSLEEAAENGLPEFTLLQDIMEIDFTDMLHSFADGTIVKELIRKELNLQRLDSCIQDGFKGVSFYYTRVMAEQDYIDIVVRYRIQFPIPFFSKQGIKSQQGVRLRAWAGYRAVPKYSTEKPEPNTMVYITTSGTVYHLREDCSHIKLSVREVTGDIGKLRNVSGGIYYPCESCYKGTGQESSDRYYITEYGTRYHSKNNCSKIKRNVRKVPVSEVIERNMCKRCGT